MDTPRILPHPQNISLRAEVYKGDNPRLQELATFLIGSPCPAAIQRVPGLPPDHPLPGDEAYSLVVSETAISVHAMHDHGFFYGIHTLRQIIAYYQEQKEPLRQLIIHDWPHFRDRGFMLDVSRNRIPQRQTLTYMIDLLAALKYNHLELYFEQVFQYSGHEEVWQPFGGISSEDIRWLNEACAARAIELVPNQNSFGHMRHWLECAPYKPLAEAPNGFLDPWGHTRAYPFSLSPVAAGVDEFLADLYDQLLPHFSSPRFNVGLDETFDLGQGQSTGAVQRLMQQIIATGTVAPEEARSKALGQTYLGMWKRIHHLVQQRGKTMEFWGDIIQNHPELIPELPKDILAIEWGYEADHPFSAHCERLQRSDIPFLVAPGTGSWNSPAGRYATAEANIQNSVQSAVRFHGQGLLLTDWGDNGHLQPFEISVPAIAYAGALSWNPLSPPPTRADVFQWVGKYYGESSAAGSLIQNLTTLDETFGLPHIMNTSILGVALLSFDNPAHQNYIPFHDGARLYKLREYLNGLELELSAVADPRRGVAVAVRLAQYAVHALIALNPDASPKERELVLSAHRRARGELISYWQEHYLVAGLEDSLSILDAAARQHTAIDGRLQ